MFLNESEPHIYCVANYSGMLSRWPNLKEVLVTLNSCASFLNDMDIRLDIKFRDISGKYHPVYSKNH